MAKVEFVGFVDDVLRTRDDKAFGLKVTENHSKKDGDNWITVGRTYRKLKAGYVDGVAVQIDFGAFKRGDRIKVTGVESTVMREYGDKKFYDLVVAAHTVELMSSAKPAQTSSWDLPYTDDGTAPF